MAWVTARRIGYSEAPLDRETFTVGMVAELTEEQVEQCPLPARTYVSRRLTNWTLVTGPSW